MFVLITFDRCENELHWTLGRRSAIDIEETLPPLELFISFLLLFGHFDLIFCGFFIHYDYYYYL